MNIALVDHALIALGFVFRYPHPDERSSDSTNRSANSSATQRHHDRSRGDEGTDSWNRQGTYTDKEAKRATEDASCYASRRRTFRCLGVLLMGEILAAAFVWQQGGYVLASEARCSQLVDDSFGLSGGWNDCDDGFHTHGGPFRGPG